MMCYGWQRSLTPIRCECRPIWQAGVLSTCGLHLAAAIRQQIEDGAREVVVRYTTRAEREGR